MTLVLAAVAVTGTVMGTQYVSAWHHGHNGHNGHHGHHGGYVSATGGGGMPSGGGTPSSGGGY